MNLCSSLEIMLMLICLFVLDIYLIIEKFIFIYVGVSLSSCVVAHGSQKRELVPLEIATGGGCELPETGAGN